MAKISKTIITTALIASSIISSNSYAVEFKDMPNNWAKPALQRAVDADILRGSDGKIDPYGNLTKAELATIINRVFGIKIKTSLGKYKDVSKNAWYRDDLARAVRMGYIQGNNELLEPEKPITREEAFTVLGRAFDLNGEFNNLFKFKDGHRVSNWAAYGTNGLITGGYLHGDYKNNLNPKKNITRAEFAQLMDNIVKDYISKPGTYNVISNLGNIVISSPDVILKDVYINGDIIISEGVLNGNVILDNINVNGRIIIKGGKKVDIKNRSIINGIIVNDKMSKLDLNIGEKSLIRAIDLKTQTKVSGSGKVDNVYVELTADNSKIEIDDVSIFVHKDAKNVLDLDNKKIKPGEEIKVDKGLKSDREEAYERLEELRKDASKYNDKKIKDLIGDIKNVTVEDSLADIKDAIYDLRRLLRDKDQDIEEKLDMYEEYIVREYDIIGKKENISEIESELKSIISKIVKSPTKHSLDYNVIDSYFIINLEEKDIKHKFKLKVRSSDIVESDKLDYYKELQELRLEAFELDIKDIDNVIRRYEYVSMNSSKNRIIEAVNEIKYSIEKSKLEAKERLTQYEVDLKYKVKNDKIYEDIKDFEIKNKLEKDLKEIIKKNGNYKVKFIIEYNKTTKIVVINLKESIYNKKISLTIPIK